MTRSSDEVPGLYYKPYLFSWKFLMSELSARLAIAVVGIIWSVSGYVFTRRVMPLDWQKYAYPFDQDQAFPESLTVVYLVCWYVVTAVSILLMLRCRGKWSTRMLLEELTLSLLGISLCILMTWAITETLKRMYGRPRPDFLSRCFGENNPAVWMAQRGWTSWDEVPEIPNCPFPGISHYNQLDGRQSFPSAHSGLTSTAMAFMGLWLYSKLSLFRNLGAWRIAIPVFYMGFALTVAISRTADYRHHPSDVVAGLVLGTAMAILAAAFYLPMKLEPVGADIYKIRSNEKRPKRWRPRLQYRSAAKLLHGSVESGDSGEDLFVENQIERVPDDGKNCTAHSHV